MLRSDTFHCTLRKCTENKIHEFQRAGEAADRKRCCKELSLYLLFEEMEVVLSDPWMWDSAEVSLKYKVLVLYRHLGDDDVTANVPCFSNNEALSLLSSLVAKQWLFLQNWNPIPAASVHGRLSLLSPSHDIPWGSAANNTELLWHAWEGRIDCGKTGGDGL